MLLFLESIGTSELLFIAVAALVLFGPRKLPELARSLGRSLNEFKRASEDFKQTWQREVEAEKAEWREHVSQFSNLDDLKDQNRASAADMETDGALLTATTLAPPEVKTLTDANELAVRPPQGVSIARERTDDFDAPVETNLSETTAPCANGAGVEKSAQADSPPNAVSASRKRDWL
jgi:sec-independent protein translocase protein TatA